MKNLKHYISIGLMFFLFLSFFGCGDDNSQKTLTGNVNISGEMKVGEEVTANITGSNGTDGKFTYQWTRTSEGGTALEITGANGQRFVITEDEVDHTLGVIMGNADTIGTRTGTAAEKVAIPNPAITEFPDVVLFETFTANIRDERTAAGSATLEDIKVGDKDIITIIQEAIDGAFNIGEGMAGAANKNRFRNVFGQADGVTIIVNNPAAAYKLKALDAATIYFHIDYLRGGSINQQDIADAVNAMNTGGASLPHEVTKAIINDAQVRLASVGASRQHQKPISVYQHLLISSTIFKI